MKNKPTRHKQTNTFQFKKFSERINEIDVDVFHRVIHRNEENQENAETHFYQTLQKWNLLNMSQDYSGFKKKVRNIVTLPQLINQKQYVVDTLIEYLEKRNILCLQPLLELVVALARDLQKEFYGYFPKFLTIVIDLLKTKDTEQIEYTFTTLAYLFKFLWRYLIKNVKTVFDLLLPLLSDSQPVYINNFAAESFSFIVRKIKDKNLFVKSILQDLEDQSNNVAGCGKLLFEVISGTTGQFHSCAEQILTLYFDALEDESIDQNVAYNVLQHIIQRILESIYPQHSIPLWNTFLKLFNKSVDTESQRTGRENNLVLVLRLLYIVIDHRQGKILTNPVSLIDKLIEIIDKFETENNILEETMNVSVIILLSSTIKLTQEISTKLLFKIIFIPNIELLYNTVEKLLSHGSFESLILPQILKRSLAIGIDSKALHLYAQIITKKAPPSLDGTNLEKWKKMTLDLKTLSTRNSEYLIEHLTTLSKQVSLDALKILIILPHLQYISEEMKVSLKKEISSLYNQLLNHEGDRENLDKLSFVFLLALDSIIHIFEPQVLHEFLTNSNIKLLELLKYNESIVILNILDLYLTYFKETQIQDEYINRTTFDLLNDHLAKHLGSQFHKVRLTVSHIYSLFSNVKELTSVTEGDNETAMELIYLAENEPVGIQTYRNRLLHLGALAFQSNAITALNSKYHEFPIRYLLSNLYINFSLLWEPVMKIIATYVDNNRCEKFWPVFLSELKSENMRDTSYKTCFQCDILSKLEIKISQNDDKPDLENYKILLWKCMGYFIDFSETKSEDFSEIFINFVNNDVFKSNSEDAKSCSIIEYEKDSKDERVDNEVEEDHSNQSDKTKHKRKLLITQMEIFSKMHNPRKLYKESEIYQIYLDLLSSKNPQIQKTALDCLFTYRHKYLLPYKEHLYNILNENHLKNELALFKIDKESNMILEEHRDGLIPILLRIIYAKMTMKTGMRTGGKAGALVRKKSFLRFLAGANEPEMFMFIKMIFQPFRKYVPIITTNEDTNIKKLTDDIIEEIDLNNVIPPKRLKSIVNLLAVIIEQFGGKMEQLLLPQLLRILLCIVANVTGILKRSDQVHSGYLPSIKNARNHCINILARFFTHFENYPWNKYEIDALYDIAIYPWLEKLPIEGIHSPTPLLKLFMSWSENSRYHPLFIKYERDNNLLSPLPYIIRLLLGVKTQAPVKNAILDMMEKLLTLNTYGVYTDTSMEVDTQYLPLNKNLDNLIEIDEKSLSSGINYGSVILFPHVLNILAYIKSQLRKSKKGINKTCLTILSRISEFAKDPELCDTLLVLIYPILIKKTMLNENEDTIIELITTVINLTNNVEKGENHLRSIAPLLGSVSSVPARKLIIRLYENIGNKADQEYRDKMLKNVEILTSLNAWDKKWIDQPDFQRRLDAFSDINKFIENNSLMLEFGAAIIHNCFYLLKNESDLAMKHCAGECLKTIGPALAKQYQNVVDKNYLIEETILISVRKGIKSKNESVYLQSIAFLGQMASECSEFHPIMKDLHLLCNKTDPEVDFFENMQHLQLHRKARALLKFCNISKTLTKAPNPRTLTQFIFPLASSFLCNESFIHKNSIIDAAIETIGTICKLLPWYHYELILKFYLNKIKYSLEFQKQIVRLIIVILDAFHYDLSKYKNLEANELTEIVDKINPEEETDIVNENDTKTNEGDLDDELNVGNNDEDVETNKETKQIEVAILERHTILSQSKAKQVVFNISKILLPQLHRAITMKAQYDNIHKSVKQKMVSEIEEEDLLRIPIALAFVKLLQKLPNNVLDINLPGVFMRLCTFLKSRLESVRRATRDILQKIMITLGPEYLYHLLREMNTLLTRGFQIHVLVFTIQSVLVALKPYFKPLQIDQNLQSILSVCKVDLFGLTGEEKEIIGIVKHTSEAKSTKSYDIFHILGEFITESCLLDMISPLKDILFKTHSHKTVNKITECFRNIMLGLADNKYIPLDKILMFLYGIASDSIPDFAVKKTDPKTEKEIEAIGRQKPDCFIIPPEPKSRMGIKVAAKTTKDTNVHVIIEFSFKLFHILLKREKLSNEEFNIFLDPFVPILKNSLKSQHVKICGLALHCLNWLLKMDLDSVRESISDICTSIFEILHKYAAAGLSKGDNFDLVMVAFKCMSILVRDVKHFTINADQLKLLLLYVEQDLHDSDKQATAFTLLRAILNRKLIVPEVHPVMQKVAVLSVTSELDHIKQQSRSVFYTYLMEYPLGKLLDKHIAFYLSQLSYELQPGRLSALEMIHSIVTGFPLKILTQQSGLIFLMISARLVNDDDPTCRKLIAKCIKEMITRISHNDRIKLFDVSLLWLKDSKLIHRRLAVQVIGIFVTVEKEHFTSRLCDLLPILLKQFYNENEILDNEEPGRSVKLIKPITHEKKFDKGKDEERIKDHHYFQIFQLLLKLCAHCPGFLTNSDHRESIRSFAEYAQSLLAHPHLWVRLGSSQFIGFILADLDIDKVTKLFNSPDECDENDGYMYVNTVETLRSLTLDLTGQLQTEVAFEQLTEQVVKNLILIAKIFNSIGSCNNETNEIKVKDNNELSLLWLMRKLRKAVNVEVTQTPKSTNVRKAVFKWIAGIVNTIPVENLNGIMFSLMSPLVREISMSEESNAALRRLAKEVVAMIKKRIGHDDYTRLLVRVQQKIDSKRAERKKIRTQQFITDPELAAKRKITKQQRKKDAKKRKMDVMKGKKTLKKRKKTDVDFDV